MAYIPTLAVLPYIGVAREARGPGHPKFLKRAVILWFERRYSKQNSVFCLKSNIFPPPKLLGWLRYCFLITP